MFRKISKATLQKLIDNKKQMVAYQEAVQEKQNEDIDDATQDVDRMKNRILVEEQVKAMDPRAKEAYVQKVLAKETAKDEILARQLAQEKNKTKFSKALKKRLAERGLVPSYDGTVKRPPSPPLGEPTSPSPEVSLIRRKYKPMPPDPYDQVVFGKMELPKLIEEEEEDYIPIPPLSEAQKEALSKFEEDEEEEPVKRSPSPSPSPETARIERWIDKHPPSPDPEGKYFSTKRLNTIHKSELMRLAKERGWTHGNRSSPVGALRDFLSGKVDIRTQYRDRTGRVIKPKKQSRSRSEPRGDRSAQSGKGFNEMVNELTQDSNLANLSGSQLRSKLYQVAKLLGYNQPYVKSSIAKLTNYLNSLKMSKDNANNDLPLLDEDPTNDKEDLNMLNEIFEAYMVEQKKSRPNRRLMDQYEQMLSAAGAI